MGANVQVCWEKFCRYWDVEPRLVPMEPDRLHLRGPQAVAQCDENTIGVVAILGSTMDGSYEPVAEICAALDHLAGSGGPDIPIHVDGANFSCGDGHGVQGDGEVCITAIETGLTGTFELHVRDDMTLEWPMAETPTHVMTMAFDPDLDDAVVIALRDMIKLICARTGISREDAYTLCSLAADLRITQVVNGAKGVHVMLEKAHLVR